LEIFSLETKVQGVHTIKKLQEENLPSSVLVIDGSTAGFRLFPVFETYRNCKFIIIDAIRIPVAISGKTTGNISDNKDKKILPIREICI